MDYKIVMARIVDYPDIGTKNLILRLNIEGYSMSCAFDNVDIPKEDIIKYIETNYNKLLQKGKLLAVEERTDLITEKPRDLASELNELKATLEAQDAKIKELEAKVK